MFLSLLYNKSHNSVSYFVQYSLIGNTQEKRFGSVDSFFMCNGCGYAVIKHYSVKELFRIKEECIEHWSKRIRSSRTNKNNDEQLQDDDNDDELPDMIERTLQMAGNTFQHLRI
ncbi:unnamed protein product [Rotaria sordida]|uniref:Uncharacterized protein n=1 Tax=Rotaria sordida TaxID=392033 RepID=A0A819MW48_9BILA|nr:unnamed protein product [Rotaria sordida]